MSQDRKLLDSLVHEIYLQLKYNEFCIGRLSEICDEKDNCTPVLIYWLQQEIAVLDKNEYSYSEFRRKIEDRLKLFYLHKIVTAEHYKILTLYDHNVENRKSVV